MADLVLRDEWVEAADKALNYLELVDSRFTETQHGLYPVVKRMAAERVLAAVVPLITAQTLRETADLILNEARWQKESEMRGGFANGYTSIERLLMLWHVIDDRLDSARGAMSSIEEGQDG